MPGCLNASPRELKLYFNVNLRNLEEPAFCQDMDIMANALGVSIEVGLDPDMRANITSIGDATIARNPDTGNPGKKSLEILLSACATLARLTSFPHCNSQNVVAVLQVFHL